MARFKILNADSGFAVGAIIEIKSNDRVVLFTREGWAEPYVEPPKAKKGKAAKGGAPVKPPVEAEPKAEPPVVEKPKAKIKTRRGPYKKKGKV